MTKASKTENPFLKSVMENLYNAEMLAEKRLKTGYSNSKRLVKIVFLFVSTLEFGFSENL